MNSFQILCQRITALEPTRGFRFLQLLFWEFLIYMICVFPCWSQCCIILSCVSRTQRKESIGAFAVAWYLRVSSTYLWDLSPIKCSSSQVNSIYSTQILCALYASSYHLIFLSFSLCVASYLHTEVHPEGWDQCSLQVACTLNPASLAQRTRVYCMMDTALSWCAEQRSTMESILQGSQTEQRLVPCTVLVYFNPHYFYILQNILSIFYKNICPHKLEIKM